ncbi:MAG: OmpH family outer membrane protein, partial [Gemmatimonas sp.]
NALNEKLDAEQQKAMLAVFEDLEKAIPVVAKARGVGLVLRVHQVPQPPAGITGQRATTGRLRAFENKQVWFASEEVDLTPDLIKYLMVPRDGDKAATPPKNDSPKTDAEKKDGAGKPAETQQGSK